MLPAKPKNPKEKANKGASLLAVKVRAPAEGPLRFVVVMELVDEKESEPIRPEVAPLADWGGSKPE